MERFSDHSLHILVHLSGSKSTYSLATLRNAIKSFQKVMLDPLIERGWVTTRSRAGSNVCDIVEITEAGEKWLRKLCDLSEAEAKV